MPRRPSQKSIDVCRPAPTRVMWWTPWLWSFRTILDLVLHEFRLVFVSPQALPRHEIHASLHDEDLAQSVTDRFCEHGVGRPSRRQLDGDGQRRLLLDPRRP